MRRKSQSITNKFFSIAAILFLLILWQMVSMLGLVPSFMLPSPAAVVKAFVADFSLLMMHLRVTLIEAFTGLGLGILIGFAAAMAMDRFEKVKKALYPILVITQTIPTIAIAPLLVLWMGYGIAPKVTLVVIVTFFPIAVSLQEGFQSADPDTINLMKAMGASKGQIFRYVKLPGAMNSFFTSLKISVSYSVVGAVISEWLGGFEGLGVYMTRVRSAYSFEKMFAVIFLISAISLLLMWGVGLLRKSVMRWERVR